MRAFLKRLLGISHTATVAQPLLATDAPSHEVQQPVAARRTATRQASSEGGAGDPSNARDVVARYFELSATIERGKADRDFPAAVRAARETYPLLSAFVRRWKRESGDFGISTSHAVHTAPTLMAVLEDADGIRELRAALEATGELRAWLPAADRAEEDLALVPRIMAVASEEPGVVQSTLKTRLGLTDGIRLSQLAAWLDKGGRIYRVKQGASYRLYPAGYVMPTAEQARLQPRTAPSPATASPLGPAGQSRDSSSTPVHVASPAGRATPSESLVGPAGAPEAWRDRIAKRARLLDFSDLPVIRLPMAPPSWEAKAAAQGSQITDEARSAEPRFAVEGDGWRIATETKLAPADRPNPAYKQVFQTGRFTYALDPKGKRDGFTHAASVLRVSGRTGQAIAEGGLPYDVYRADVSPDGSSILFLSREGILHGYTDSIEPFIEARLIELPEYQAQAERLGIEPRELKNHTRCVAVSADRRRYLVTIVDEAWCLETTSGAIVWGFRMPTKEGWTQHVTERTERSGTSVEVDTALHLMDLRLPLGPDDLVRQYRALAMRWHPDRNPEDPTATGRFQELGAAFELLTGTDLSGLSGPDVERVTYEQVISTGSVGVTDRQGGAIDVGFTASVVVGEKYASDWIYAANVGKDGRVFLAGYSGKVVVVSAHGIPELVYDVGAVPRRIVDAGEHLYILTDTRLYVLAGDRLEALVDVYGASDVLVADRGFALLEPKALTWFTPAGGRVGSIRTKDPLRRAFSTDAGLVVETRQHRAVVTGADSWWDEAPLRVVPPIE